MCRGALEHSLGSCSRPLLWVLASESPTRRGRGLCVTCDTALLHSGPALSPLHVYLGWLHGGAEERKDRPPCTGYPPPPARTRCSQAVSQRPAVSGRLLQSNASRAPGAQSVQRPTLDLGSGRETEHGVCLSLSLLLGHRVLPPAHVLSLSYKIFFKKCFKKS